MGFFQVTTKELKSKVEELRGLNGKFKTELTALQTIEGTLNGQWEGTANDTFHKRFTSEITKISQFYTLIEKYAAALSQIAGEYETVEAKNTQIAGSRLR